MEYHYKSEQRQHVFLVALLKEQSPPRGKGEKMDAVYQWALELIVSLAGKYPIVITIVSVIGVLRLVFKPLFTFLHAVVDAVPGDADNKLLDGFEKGKAYQVAKFVLDLFASVKLPG